MRTSSFSRRAKLALSVAALALTCATPTRAYEATQAEADRIRNVLEEYVGHPAPGAPRVVDLKPNGESYTLEVDFDALLAAVNTTPEFQMKLGRSLSRLTPLPDGTWRQSLDSFPDMAFTTGKDRSGAHYEGLSADGIFDPAVGYFRNWTLRAAKLTGSSTHAAEGTGPEISAEAVQEGMEMISSAAPAASGTGVDATVSQKIAKFTETLRSTGGDPGTPEMNMVLATSDNLVDMHVAGLRYRELLDMWKWVIAHRGTDAVKADPAGFKQRLAALGTVFDEFGGITTIRNLGIETPFGFGGATTLKIGLDGTGATRDGRLGFAFDLTELKVHTMLAPAWALRLLPTEITLRARADGWNAADVFTTWLGMIDFAAPRALTAEETARLTALALPKGAASVDVSGNHMRGALWDLTVDGGFSAGPTGAKGTLTVKATGIDAVAAALAEPRADPNAKQALAGLAMAAAMAVREGDAHVWRFVFDGNDVVLNGRSIGTPKQDAPVPAPPPPEKAPEPLKKKLQNKI